MNPSMRALTHPNLLTHKDKKNTSEIWNTVVGIAVPYCTRFSSKGAQSKKI